MYRKVQMSENQLLKKDIQNRLNLMRIKPNGLNSRTYDVSIKYFSQENPTPDKRIDYRVTSDLKIVNGVGELSINKEDFFYNQREPDLINEIISNSISKSVYPILTHYNEKGISSNEILNLKEITERWEKEKKKLLEKYNSSYLDDVFKKFEEKLQNKTSLERGLQYDWFWNLYFHPKLINYGEKRTIEKKLLLSIVPYSPPFQFKGIQKIEKIPTNYHSFIVTFDSEEALAPQYFYPKNINEENPVFMSLDVSFDLDLYHHFPMHTVAELKIFSKDKFNNKTIIKKINFSMYQVNSDEYQFKTLSEDSPFITGGLVKLPPNKWGFDNFEDLENDW